MNWEKQHEGQHKVLREFYRNLILLRRTVPALKKLDKINLETFVIEEDKVLVFRRGSNAEPILCLFNFNETNVTFQIPFDGIWQKILDSTDEQWMGSGSTISEEIRSKQTVTLGKQSFVLYKSKTPV